MRFTESIVEQAAPAWLEALGCAVRGSDTLAALRDALLPKLLSGAIRVRDAEKAVGKAV